MYNIKSYTGLTLLSILSIYLTSNLFSRGTIPWDVHWILSWNRTKHTVCETLLQLLSWIEYYGPGPSSNIFSSVSSSLVAAPPVFQGGYCRWDEENLGSNCNWSCTNLSCSYFKMWAHCSPHALALGFCLHSLKNNSFGWYISSTVGAWIWLPERRTGRLRTCWKVFGCTAICTGNREAMLLQQEPFRDSLKECYQAFSEPCASQNIYWHDRPQWI